MSTSSTTKPLAPSALSKHPALAKVAFRSVHAEGLFHDISASAAPPLAFRTTSLARPVAQAPTVQLVTHSVRVVVGTPIVWVAVWLAVDVALICSPEPPVRAADAPTAPVDGSAQAATPCSKSGLTRRPSDTTTGMSFVWGPVASVYETLTVARPVRS